MQTILVASRKGGSGKTSLAVHLAALADTAAAPALLIDADPQGSSTFWYNRREATTPLLSNVDAGGVANVLKDARASKIATAIIDSPPHDAIGIATLMRLADLAVIPPRPGPLDLAAVASTIEIARACGTPFVVILNATPPPRHESEMGVVTEARQVLDELGAPVLSTYVSQRAVLSHSLISGEAVNEFAPESAAAIEIAKAWDTIKKVLKQTGVRNHGTK
jgi:chromosome partitioning protein